MIRLSNGHTFECMAASGALGFHGKGWPWERPLGWIPLWTPLSGWTRLFQPSLFTVVMKTVTLKPRRGNFRRYNPFGCIRILRDGTVNAVGLTNSGIDWWCRKIGPRVDSTKIPLVGSILGEPDELVEMARMLNGFDLVALEINASCPNTEDDILTNTAKIIEGCLAVKSVSRFPIILKLSVVHEAGRIVGEVKGMVEAFSINSVPWRVVFPNRRSPLEHLGGGGVSGKLAQPCTWRLVYALAKMSQVPVIGPSVWDFEDIQKLRSLGSQAVSFGAIFLRYPWRPTLFVRKDKTKN